MQSVLHPICLCAAVWRLTGGAQGGFDEGFRSGGYWLHWPGLFGCQLFQTHSSLVKHVLHRQLFLENLLHLVLMDTNHQKSIKNYTLVCVSLGEKRWVSLVCLTLNCWLRTASYSVQMVLGSESWFCSTLFR